MSHSRIRTASKWGVVPASILVSGLLVWQASYAAFSSNTSNPTSNWTAGTVALTDDDGGSTALFTASALKPGSTGTKCIVVTSSGNLASAVKLYATTYSTTNALGSYINLVVDEGTGGTFAGSGPTSCTGFTSGGNDFTGTLAAFSAKTSYATGVSAWTPTGSGSESRTFRITYTIDSAAPNSSQGGTAALGFTWEAQNT